MTTILGILLLIFFIAISFVLIFVCAGLMRGLMFRAWHNEERYYAERWRR